MYTNPMNQKPTITVITPSIRPYGLKMTFETLQKQTYKDFEWLPRLSIPGERSDLCYQMNQALKEAKGEIIVFLQDYIEVPENALQFIADLYEHSEDAYTFPMIKNGEKDWRCYDQNNKEIEPKKWEIDFGCAKRKEIEMAGGFFERYDEGFGWENVDLAYVMWKNGCTFRVNNEIVAHGEDHDSFIEHPYKRKPNADLWHTRKQVIDMIYEDV